MKASINQVIDEFNTLVPKEQEFVVSVFQKIIIEGKRDRLSRTAKKAVSNLKAGKIKKGTSKDLYNDLEND